jgi:hypothetical protein
MDEPQLQYRIWQYGQTWQWQVMSDDKQILTSGVAVSRTAARIAALNYCRDRQHQHK